MDELARLAQLLKQRNLVDKEIAAIIGRPALSGHIGEFLAARIFDIDLEHSASTKGLDGRFSKGPLTGKSVDVKYVGKQEGLLDLSPTFPVDYYLVLTGPKSGAISSRGLTRPWVINHVFLFHAQTLLAQLAHVKVGIATSVRSLHWTAAELYPEQRNPDLPVSDRQRGLLALFSGE